MKTALTFLLTLSTTLAWAYPIYFKCEKDGSLSQVVTPNELASKLQQVVNTANGLSPQKQKEFLSETCRGGKSCIEELEQLLKMSQASGKVTEEWVKSTISKVKQDSAKATSNLQGLVKLPQAQGELLSQYNNIVKNAAESAQCRIAEANLPADKFSLDNGSCVVANLHHSPYMYVAGLRESGTNKPGNMFMGAPRCNDIDEMIKGAVASGQDPYAALAISFMENGTEVHGLYLDPIGMVQTLGCPTARGTAEKHNLNSYNTYYNVNYKTIENSPLISKIKNYLAVKKIKTEEKESYFCNAEGGGGYSTTKPNDKACCLKLPFTLASNNIGDPNNHPIAKALTFKSFDQYIKAPLKSQLKTSDPAENAARRLQRFNGYSVLMGGAEGVSAWRSGVNYFKTPAYGYQAMDFLVNSMITNPFIAKKVSEAEAALGKKSPSVLCMELPQGVFSLEHDYYFNKHANSPRMEVILDKWKQNKTGLTLTKSQNNVMIGEISAVIASKKYPEFNKMLEGFKPFAKEPIPPKVLNYYFEKIYPDRRTVAQANQMDQGFEWNEMKDQKFSAFLESYKEVVKESNGENVNLGSGNGYGVGIVIPITIVDKDGVIHIAPKDFKAPDSWPKSAYGQTLPPADFVAPKEWKTMAMPVFDQKTQKMYLPPKGFKFTSDWQETPYGKFPPQNWKPDSGWKEYSMEDYSKEYSKVMKDSGYDMVSGFGSY